MKISSEIENFVRGGMVFSCVRVSGLQKGPEKRCRAKIVEKCRKTLLTFLTIFDVFLPCAKIVEKCRKTF